MAFFFNRALATILFFFGALGAAQAQPIPLTNTTYRQNFDTLSNTDGSTTASALPTGWMLIETGGGPRDDERYAVDIGVSNVGDTYSYGAAGSTERALGTLRSSNLVTVFGTCFRNQTSGPLTEFTMGYTGEHWRLGTAGRTDSLVFEYSLDSASLANGTWHPIPGLNFATPNPSGGTGMRDGNATGNRLQRSVAVSSLVAGGLPQGDSFCIRWSDSDASGADDGLAVDDFWITAGRTTLPTITVSDASRLEGDSGTAMLSFPVFLSKPAGEGGVTFNISTSDGSAIAGSDYRAVNATGITIPPGGFSVTLSVVVNGDTAIEPDETLLFNIGSVSGAAVGDALGIGTIQNDDVPLVQIHDIQGNGARSPLNGTVVATEGIVTAQKANNGFFLQTADANVDADPNTSQGIFVFTSTAPPATAAVGNRIRVTGTVTEFLPSTDLNQLSITQIVSVTSIQVLSTDNPLPPPVELTVADFGASALPGTAERYEGMRVSVASALTISGTDGNISESSASASSTGTFHITLNGVARPFREPGISVMDVFPIPGGKTPPRFDTNQERLMVRSRGQVGASPVAIDAGTDVNGMVGVLDYFSGTWALLPDPGTVSVSGGKTPTAVADARYEDVTIGSFNLMRFYDEVDDGNAGPTLSQAALDTRLGKASLAICDYLKAPDILGVVEAENARVLGLLADRINSTCARAPLYMPYLVQGNDPAGMNIGFLVSNRIVGTGTRVEVLEMTQYGRNTLFANPDGSALPLYQHPPLMLRVRVHQDNGAIYPLAVIASHLRSMQGIDDSSGGNSGWTTEGHRVRAERGQQALFLANLVQSMQTAYRREHIVLLGDFNAFEFNDGYVDVMGIVRGDEVPATQVINDVDSPITRPLIDGSDLIVDAAEKYSYVRDGNAQMLGHVVLNEALVMDVEGIIVEHARINADFGVHHYGVAGNALRVSDHDPVRVAIGVRSFRNADLAVSASATNGEVRVGDTASYSVVVDNIGPSDAEYPSLALVFDARVSPLVTTPAGWTCAAPLLTAVDTTVTCTGASLANGERAAFTVDVPTNPDRRDRTLHIHAAVASAEADPANANNRALVAVRMFALADLSVVASNGGDVFGPGNGRFTVDIENRGPDRVSYASVAMVFNALVSVSETVAPDGWSCTSGIRNSVDRTTTVTCVSEDFASGERITITAYVPYPNLGFGVESSLTMAAATTSLDKDIDPGNNQSLTSLSFRLAADLGLDIGAQPEFVSYGNEAAFLVVMRNYGPLSSRSLRVSMTIDAVIPNAYISGMNSAGLTCTAPILSETSTTFSCTRSSDLPVGSSASFGVRFPTNASMEGRTYRVTAVIESDTVDQNPHNNTSTSNALLVRAPASFSITHVAEQEVLPRGTPARLITTITNTGSIQAEGVKVSFLFVLTPYGVIFTHELPPGWSCGRVYHNGYGQVDLSCTVDAMSPGNVAVIRTTLTNSYGSFTSSASASEYNYSPSRYSGVARITYVDPIDPSVHMTGPGKRKGTWQVAVRNNGLENIASPRFTLIGNARRGTVTVTPAASWTCAEAAVANGFRYDCSSPLEMQAGSEAPFILSLASPGPRQTTVSASIAPSVGTRDRNPANNTVRFLLHNNASPRFEALRPARPGPLPGE